MNFRNIVDVLILTVLEALSAVILVLAYRPPTKETATIYVLATTLHAVTYSTHGTDCLHLLCVGKEGRLY